MVDTVGGHYGVILKTRKKGGSNVLFVEYSSGILFVEDELL